MSGVLLRESGIIIVSAVDFVRLIRILNHSSLEKLGAHDNDTHNLLVEGFECNVAEETSVKEVFSDVMQTFGKIDTVIASAGTSTSSFSRLNFFANRAAHRTL